VKQLVQLYEVFEDTQHVYLVMELVEGEELFTLVNKERISENKAQSLIRDVLIAVSALHDMNIIH
jgi:serine/threonine protein kinase